MKREETGGVTGETKEVVGENMKGTEEGGGVDTEIEGITIEIVLLPLIPLLWTCTGFQWSLTGRL